MQYAHKSCYCSHSENRHAAIYELLNYSKLANTLNPNVNLRIVSSPSHCDENEVMDETGNRNLVVDNSDAIICSNPKNSQHDVDNSFGIEQEDQNNHVYRALDDENTSVNITPNQTTCTDMNGFSNIRKYDKDVLDFTPTDGSSEKDTCNAMEVSDDTDVVKNVSRKSCQDQQEESEDNHDLDEKDSTVTKIISSTNLITTSFLVRLALKHTYKPNRSHYDDHPVVVELQKMQKRVDIDAGWLRVNESKAGGRTNPDKRSFLSTDEKELLLKLALILKPIVPHTTSKLAYAWGISRNSVNNIINRACESNDLCPNRKRRSDVGITMENSEKKRKAVITPLFVFKKLIRIKYKQRQRLNDCKGFRQVSGNVNATNSENPIDPVTDSIPIIDLSLEGENGDKFLTDKQLREMWNSLSTDERLHYVELAKKEQSNLTNI